jgi:hypothetical protein
MLPSKRWQGEQVGLRVQTPQGAVAEHAPEGYPFAQAESVPEAGDLGGPTGVAVQAADAV